MPSLQLVDIEILVFFFAPADFSFFTAVFEIFRVASPKEEILGDPNVTAVRLNLAVTLHFEAGEDVMVKEELRATEMLFPFEATSFAVCFPGES